MLIIREATSEDAKQIAQLHTQSWRENYQGALTEEYLKYRADGEREAVWLKRFEQSPPNQLVLIGEWNHRFCGFICVFGNNHVKHGSVIDNLHVMSELKGSGIGTQLLKAAALWSEQNYPDLGLYLEVLACNPKAIGFYESLGAKFLQKACWDAPCGSKVDEFVYGWSRPKLLLEE